MPETEEEIKFTYHHLLVFCLTFSSYSFFHATRKTLSNVKSSISAEWTPEGYFESNKTHLQYLPNETWNSRRVHDRKDADIFLGYMDTSFMVSYSLGLFLSGYLGDKFELRKVLSFGMVSSGVVVLCFGYVTQVTHFYHDAMYLGLMVLNGLLQSLGWPSVVAIMGNWFGKSSRGLILGLWSSCASVGNIIGALITAHVLKNGYEYAFLITSTLLIGLGIINFFSLLSSPSDLIKQRKCYRHRIFRDGGQGNQGNQDPLLGGNETEDEPEEKDEPIKFLAAFRLPGVLLCALAYAFLKLVNYSFFFWLPLYLDRTNHWAEDISDKISIWYDVGGIIGGTIGGFISDRIGYRGIVVLPMLILAIPTLIFYSYLPSTSSITLNAFLLALCGVFIGGVASLISAAISADLGQQEALASNQRALATVTGIIDGTGSIGAAIGQVSLPYIELNFGWGWVFYMFVFMTGFTAIFLAPMFVKDIKNVCNSCRRGAVGTDDEPTGPPVRESRSSSLYTDLPPSYEEAS